MLGGSLYLPQKENMDGGSADMTEKTQKLKPCPFCGGKAKITGYLLYEIKCARCRVTLPQRYESDAIAAWNRRAPQCEKE